MRFALILSLFFLSSSLDAQQNIGNERTEMVFGGEITESRRAKLFQLSESEWAKYKEIMAGPRGIWTPDLSPVWALALDANPGSPERRAYMEKMLAMEGQRVVGEMAFIKEYLAFAREQQGDLSPIDEEKFMGTSNIVMTNDRFIVLVDGNCVPCLLKTKQGLAQLEAFPKNGRDYYFVGVSNERQILDMAKALSIDVREVSNGRYTLNPQSELDSYLNKEKGFTILIRRKDDLYPANFVGL